MTRNEELEALRKEFNDKIDALQKDDSESLVFTPEKGGRYWVVHNDYELGAYIAAQCFNNGGRPKNVYRTEAAAQAMCDELNVRHELMACEGWCPRSQGFCDIGAHVVGMWCILATFKTNEQRYAAIEKVGIERIEAAARNMAGVV